MATTTAEQLAGRVLKAMLGAVDLVAIYLGDRLGWYRSLAADGPATAAELAERTGTDPRYAQEWLEQQAVTGLLTVQSPGGGQSRRYAIPSATAEVLTDASSLNYLAPFARLLAAVGPTLPDLLAAYREGGGVSWEQLGATAREAQADGNRPWFDASLAGALAGVPDLHATLSRPSARVLDVGCGGGWSTIALKRAYPGALVTGVDIDAPSLDLARANAAESGVRVEFRLGNAVNVGGGRPEEVYDVAFAFECLHDMPQPVEVLAAVRGALAPDGCLVVMDEAVADVFAPEGDEVERLMYGFSLLVCLPDSMSHSPTVATGTVMRADVLGSYANEAGFASVEVLPIENFGFWRFYRLR